MSFVITLMEKQKMCAVGIMSSLPQRVKIWLNAKYVQYKPLIPLQFDREERVFICGLIIKVSILISRLNFIGHDL